MTRILFAVLTLALALPAQFTPAVQINGQPGFGITGNDQEGLAAVHLDGRFIVFWSDENAAGGTTDTPDDLYAAISFDEGFTFPTIVRVDTGDAANASNAENVRAAVTANGVIVVIWEDDRPGINGEHIYSNWSVDGGLTWLASAVRVSFTNDADSPQLVAFGDAAYAIWEDEQPAGGNEPIAFAKFDATTLSWSAALDIHTGFSGAAGRDVDDPTLAVGPNSINVVYNDNRLTTEQTFVLTSFDGGITWINTALETSALDDTDETFVRQSGDLVVAAWIDQPAGNATNRNSIHGAISNDGGLTWTGELILTPEVEAARANNAISVDVEWFDHIVDGNTVILAYSCDIESALVGGPVSQLGTDVYVRVSQDAGVIFSAPLKINTTDTANRPRLVKAGSLVYMFYETNVNGTNGGAWAWSTDSGNTWSPGVIANLVNDVDSSDADLYSQMTPLAIDPLSGRAVHVFYNNPTGNNEVQVSSMRAPFLSTTAPAVAGNSFAFTLNALESTSTATSFLAIVSATGTGPVQIGANPRDNALFHLTPDVLTFALVNDPVLLPFFFGPIAGGQGTTSVPFFADPVLTGATVYVAGLFSESNGQIRSTDPLVITF